MGVALATTGWWLYIDVPQTANAVVICVIIFNAAFGYRFVFIERLCVLFTDVSSTAGVHCLGCTHQKLVTVLIHTIPTADDWLDHAPYSPC